LGKYLPESKVCDVVEEALVRYGKIFRSKFEKYRNFEKTKQGSMREPITNITINVKSCEGKSLRIDLVFLVRPK